MKKKFINFLWATFCISILTFVSSCSTKTTTQSDESSDLEADYEEDVDYTEEKETESLNVIIPIYITAENLDKIGSFEKYYAIKKPNGQYIMFDNEASYINYAPILCFISRVSEHLVWQDETLKDLRNSLSAIRDIDYIRQNTITNVLRYVNGEKDLIKDKTLFKEIDKIHYDYRTIERNFYLERSGYGWKSYGNVENKVSPSMTAEQYDRTGQYIYITAQNDTLPDGALILKTY